MKRLLPLIVGVLLIAGLAVKSAPSLLVGTLVTVNNTTNSSTAAAVGYLSIPRQALSITNAGLTSTGALRVNLQLSIDGSNFTTVSTYWPAATNAATELYTPLYPSPAVYMRVQTITTNSVQVGIVSP